MKKLPAIILKYCKVRRDSIMQIDRTICKIYFFFVILNIIDNNKRNND